LKLNSSLIIKVFTSILVGPEEEKTLPTKGAKRARTNSNNSVNVITTGVHNLSPSNMKLLLEFLQVLTANDKLEKTECLLPLLFKSVEILILTEDKENLEFGLRVALNCIESVCLKLEELVVRLMPVFSFMGDNLFRLDDSHSFQATADKIEKYQLIVKIFRDFVASSMHFPPHRRLAVLSNLVLSSKSNIEDALESLNESNDPEVTNENLWIMIGLLIEYH
uniref:HEAT repeat-containing protein 1 n=1 Tax=Romanomermis culicivorax TaxID=13658 RepID=A0A915J5Z4_ROMCU